jgi:hypothetical protein
MVGDGIDEESIWYMFIGGDGGSKVSEPGSWPTDMKAAVVLELAIDAGLLDRGLVEYLVGASRQTG